MAAQVSRLIKSESKSSGAPITRDFLGGGFGNESKELDLDLHVPTGWEKRLDLQSGKVYIQRCISPSTTSHHNHTNPRNQTAPYSNPKPTLTLYDDTNLDLKLVSNSPPDILPIHKNATYQSVCTLDKVRSALDRAYKLSSSSPKTSSSKKRPSPSNSDSSSMISINNNNNNDDSNPQFSSHDRDHSESEEGMLVAGACPGCLLYVLMSKTNPKCPKCNSVIPLPVSQKKPRIDLNL